MNEKQQTGDDMLRKRQDKGNLEHLDDCEKHKDRVESGITRQIHLRLGSDNMEQ